MRWIDAAAALDFEAFRGNIGALHPEIAVARHSEGLGETLARLHSLLEGSALWEPGAARFLQDPLTFRCVPQVHGAARDALRFVESQVVVELNAHQGNPLIVPAEGRLVSVGNFDSQALATALDLARLALAPVLTAAVERTLKLLSPRFSGLTEGLVATKARGRTGSRSSASPRRRSPPKRGFSPSPSRSSSLRPCRSRASRIARLSARWLRGASRRCSISAHASSRSSSWSRRRRSTYAAT